MGLHRDVFYGNSMRIPKGFLWRFYIDFYRPSKSHLPFKDLGSIGMSTGPLHMDLHWDYLEIVVRILKELIGFPRSYISIRLGILQGFHKDSKGYEAFFGWML